MDNRGSDIKKLSDLIKNVKIAMLTSVDEDGTLRSRPMATQKSEFDGDLWFFTRASSPKVDEVESHREVNVSYAEPGDNVYVSVSGTGQLVRDPAKIKELWSPALKAWFPNGAEDPEVALLRVSVKKAEFWDSPSSTVVQLVGFVKAVASGQSYEPGPGEHAKIELR